MLEAGLRRSIALTIAFSKYRRARLERWIRSTGSFWRRRGELSKMQVLSHGDPQAQLWAYLSVYAHMTMGCSVTRQGPISAHTRRLGSHLGSLRTGFLMRWA
ncbi:hypothetical protein AOQ71_29280 [Bradyrhizobium manausense]|uniref:Uncharacterized protein n=1 Tax=Bradyrhizobium manausense TaxID=989370 RepID=A0A0R3DA51_9BRAD|nr:hypothetical protein AOQ71_29280 [Bradyrhizobium manausense]